MVDSGVILFKYWLEVSEEEQTRRLEARIKDGRKTWKLTPMDLKSYSRWYDYSRARDDMFKATDTEHAPWLVANSNDKKRARLNIISDLLSRIPYKNVPREKVILPKRQKSGGYREPNYPLRRIPEKNSDRHVQADLRCTPKGHSPMSHSDASPPVPEPGRIAHRDTGGDKAGWDRWLPGLRTLRGYKIAWLRHDLVAGLVLTTMLVPVGIAYAVASGVPGIYGLYATIVPLLAYALFGPSRILVLGPDSSLAAVILAVVLPLSGGDPHRAIALAGMMAIVSGGRCASSPASRAWVLSRSFFPNRSATGT